MIEPFGGQDRDGGLGKRPHPTIEGTATEVSVEPPPSEPQAGDPVASEAAPSEPDQGKPAEAAPEETAPIGVTAASSGTAEAIKKARKSPPPRTSPSELKGFFTHLAAGLLGGLVGVLALAFLWGLPARKAQAPDLSGVERRLTKLEAEPAAAGGADAIAGLDARVTSLEEQKPEPQADLTALTNRIAKLETSLDSLAKTGEAGGSVADAAAIEVKIGEIEQRIDKKIESALAAQDAEQGKNLEAIQAEIVALKAKLGALAEAKLDQGETDESPDLAAIEERIAKLETVVPKLATEVEQGTASAQSGAAAIAFANLREAVNAGRPYAAELDALNIVAPHLGNLGVLPSRAEAGIPTVPALAASLRPSAEGSVAAAPGTASFIDSVIASAKSAVRVRRIDEGATGEGPDAVLARAEQELGKGDLASAVKEIEALPAPAQESLAPWLESARARLAANATLAELQGTLLSSLGGSSGEAKP